MDKFTKNALIVCTVLSALVIVFFYVGTALGSKDLAGTDGKVEEAAAQSGNKTPHASLIELDQNGEYVGFTSVGVIGGFAAGYLWAMVFDEANGKGGTTHG